MWLLLITKCLVKKRSYLYHFKNRKYWGLGRRLRWRSAWYASKRNQVMLLRSWVRWPASLASHWALGLVSAPASKDTMESNRVRHWHWHPGPTCKYKCVYLHEPYSHKNIPHKCTVHTCTHKHKSQKDHKVSGYGIFDTQKDCHCHIGRTFATAANCTLGRVGLNLDKMH